MKVETLHIFNPEHDIALAANLANFTAPHAGRQLRNDLGFLPALWAGDGDAVLVDNVEMAEKAYNRLRGKMGRRPCLFVNKSQLQALEIQQIEPWGWNMALKSYLKRNGAGWETLPSDEDIAVVRKLSHRMTAASLLVKLQMEGTVGNAWCAEQVTDIKQALHNDGRIVLKAPWSSSGRGVRFIEGELNEQMQGWARGVMNQQGCIMIEPYYNKVKDFGMEFTVDRTGVIHYEGLSLFHTKNGAYTGNLLATEQAKQEVLGRYVSAELLDQVRDRIISELDLGKYTGPFGVDMMIVHSTQERMKNDRLLLHPCVEINLRRTMGHVALALTRQLNPTQDDDIQRVMRVIYNGNSYQLKIQRT